MGKQNASSHRHISDRRIQNNLFHINSSFTLLSQTKEMKLTFSFAFYSLLNRISYFSDLSYPIKPVKVYPTRLWPSLSEHQAPEPRVPWSLRSVYCIVPAIVSCHNVTPSPDTGHNGHNTPGLYGSASLLSLNSFTSFLQKSILKI